MRKRHSFKKQHNRRKCKLSALSFQDVCCLCLNIHHFVDLWWPSLWKRLLSSARQQRTWRSQQQPPDYLQARLSISIGNVDETFQKFHLSSRRLELYLTCSGMRYTTCNKKAKVNNKGFGFSLLQIYSLTSLHQIKAYHFPSIWIFCLSSTTRWAVLLYDN